jgi:hypothetical protein
MDRAPQRGRRVYGAVWFRKMGSTLALAASIGSTSKFKVEPSFLCLVKETADLHTTKLIGIISRTLPVKEKPLVPAYYAEETPAAHECG